jgi:hypothetical protein
MRRMLLLMQIIFQLWKPITERIQHLHRIVHIGESRWTCLSCHGHERATAVNGGAMGLGLTELMISFDFA